MKLGTFALCAIGLVGILLPGCAGDENVGHEVIGRTREPLLTGIQIGTRCQQDYELSWFPNNGYTWGICSSFVNQAGSLGASPNFYYNLHGAKPAFETPDTCGWPCGFIDSVDLFFTTTATGTYDLANPQAHVDFAMYEFNSRASTLVMRLGASGRQNKVFSAFAGDVLRTDVYMWARWMNPFRGGLILATGGHGTMYLSTAAQVAFDYVNRINNLYPIGEAWLESAWYDDNRNTPTAAATGVNEADCSNRLGVTKTNLLSTTQLRDGAIGWFCYESWN